MTLQNARVLYKHRLELGKKVDDILSVYPELAEEKEKVEAPKEEVVKNPEPINKEVVKTKGKPKGNK